MPARDLLRLLLATLAPAMGLAGPAVAQTVQPTIAAGTAPAAITLNPVTGKVYVVNENSNDVTVLDGATGLTHSVTVGARPFWAAVNPETNKIYVSNFDDANVMILHGDTDTVSTTASTGGSGWIAIDPFLNKAFVVRFGAGDEFNIIDDETYANTAAERSYQPVAIAVNPVTHVIYLANQATGDITAVDGSVDAFYPTLYCPDGAGGFKPTPGQFDPDPGACINVPDTPVALTVNPVTNLTYALSSSPSGQISVINGVGMANPSTFVALTPPGVTEAAKAIAVNPVTNRIYAAFAGHIVVVDGATNGMTVIAAASPVAVGINVITNKIYVPNADGTLTVLDGDTNAATTIAIPTGAQAIAVNPVTNTMYVLNPDGVTPIAGAASDTIHTVPIATTIDALPGDTSGPDATLTLHATSTFSPAALATVRKVYYQLDGAGPWLAASGSGPYTASFTGLATGPHTIRAYATNGLDAPSIMTDLQFNPIVGNTAAYAFTVGSAPAKVNPSVSLATSANPVATLDPVTFTATVAGSAGMPTGTVAFTANGFGVSGCGNVALASGTAACTTSFPSAGPVSVVATYSGDASYNSGASNAISENVTNHGAAAAFGMSATSNPATAGVNVVFTVTLAGGSGPVTGSVTFLDGGVAIDGCSDLTLANGAADCGTSALSVGDHSITVRYAGAGSYEGATSPAYTETILAAAAPTTADVALASAGAMAIVSSTAGPAFPASSLIDGDRAGHNWGAGGGWRDADQNTYPDWAEIDLSGTSTIDHVVVYSIQDDPGSPVEPTDTTTFSLYGTTDFNVQVWNGSAWTTVGSVTGNNLVKRTVSFAPVATTMIRVNVTASLSGWTRLTEIEVFGTPPPASTHNVALASARCHGHCLQHRGPRLSGQLAHRRRSRGPQLGRRRRLEGRRPEHLSRLGRDRSERHIDHRPRGGLLDTGRSRLAGRAHRHDDLLALRHHRLQRPGVERQRLDDRRVGHRQQPRQAHGELRAGGHDHDPGERHGVAIGVDAPYRDRGLRHATAGFDPQRRARERGCHGHRLQHRGPRLSGQLAHRRRSRGPQLGRRRRLEGRRPNAYPDWAEIDLSGTSTIDHVVVYSIQDDPGSPVEPTDTTTFSLYGTTDFNVQVWNGSAWTTVGSVTGDNLVKRTVSFAPVATTMIRVNVTASLSGWTRLTEIEAWTP